MNSFIEILNHWGGDFLSFAWPMLWQSSLLIVAVLAFDLMFRRKLRASIRYALWLVVLVKLCVPPTLALPTSPAWWLNRTPPPVAARTPPRYTVTYDTSPLPELPLTPLPEFVPPQPVLTNTARLLITSVAVSSILLSWLLVRWWQVTRLVRRANTSEKLALLADEAQKLVGLNFPVPVKLTPNSMSPAVCGLFRPAILIPQALAENFSDEQLRAVLLHELIHLRRRDVWLNFLQSLLQIVYWWHPLVWLANARLRRVREEAVDDAVMLALRDEAESYAPTLLEVAKLALNRPLASLGLVGILESRHALRQRIERLVDFRPPRQAGLTLVSLLGILAFTAVAVPMGAGPDKIVKEENSKATNNKSSWPDPNFEGYRTIRLSAQFFIVDDAQFKASVPLLGNSGQPTLLYADEPDVLFAQLKNAGARYPDDYLGANCQSQISGIPQSYRVGGGTNHYTTVAILTTNWGGNYTNMMSGVDIEMPASQPDWTPMNFTLRALVENAGTLCRMDLSFPKAASGSRHSEIIIPPGGAIAWSVNPPNASGKRQVILLLPMDSEKYSATPFVTRAYKVNPVAVYSAWRKRGGTVDAEANPEWVVALLIQDAGVNFLYPRTANFTDGILTVHAPEKDFDKIERVLRAIGQVQPPVQTAVTNAALFPGVDISATTVTGIQTDPNFAVVLHALEQRAGVESLAKPEVVTTSGRGINRITMTNISVPVVKAGSVSSGLSAVTNTIQAKTEAGRLVQDGKLLYEMGKHSEAAAKLKAALALDPENAAAKYYLGLVQTNGLGAKLIYSGPGRQEIIKKLQAIRLDRIAFHGESLAQVLSTLSEEAKRLDPDRLGINFQISSDTKLRSTSLLDPNTGLFLTNAPATDFKLDDIPIRLRQQLTNVTLGDILDAVLLVADQPIKYSIQDYGVVFSARHTEPEAKFFMRTFKVDPNIFYRNLESFSDQHLKSVRTNGLGVGIDIGDGGPGNSAPVSTKSTAAGTSALARAFFTELGVNLQQPPGKSVYFNDRQGQLFVKATAADLDIIQRALTKLNKSEPQLRIKARFVVVSMETFAGSGQFLPVGNSAVGEFTGILTATNAKANFRRLDARPNTQTLGEPEVTTTSGLQIQMRATEVITIVTNISFHAGASGTNSLTPQSSTIETGPTLAVVPHVMADGYTIHLVLTPTFTEFLGYEETTNTNTHASYTPSGEKVDVPGIRPIVRHQQLAAQVNVWDGQTVVLAGMTVTNAVASQEPGLRRSVPKPRPGRLFVFVTATIVDPAGNRVHTDDEMPFAQTGVPPQPPQPGAK